jgi:hypothetical protein
MISSARTSRTLGRPRSFSALAGRRADLARSLARRGRQERGNRRGGVRGVCFQLRFWGSGRSESPQGQAQAVSPSASRSRFSRSSERDVLSTRPLYFSTLGRTLSAVICSTRRNRADEFGLIVRPRGPSSARRRYCPHRGVENAGAPVSCVRRNRSVAARPDCQPALGDAVRDHEFSAPTTALRAASPAGRRRSGAEGVARDGAGWGQDGSRQSTIRSDAIAKVNRGPG